jgi:hypothetical protein
MNGKCSNSSTLKLNKENKEKNKKKEESTPHLMRNLINQHSTQLTSTPQISQPQQKPQSYLIESPPL